MNGQCYPWAPVGLYPGPCFTGPPGPPGPQGPTGPAGPSGLLLMPPQRTVTAAATITMLIGDGDILIVGTPINTNVLLIDAATATFPLTIKDRMMANCQGAAGTNPITVTPMGAQTIDGLTTVSITTDGGSILLKPLPFSDALYPGWYIAP